MSLIISPKKIPSKTWRECIKKVWEIDPLLCCEFLQLIEISVIIKDVMSFRDRMSQTQQ